MLPAGAQWAEPILAGEDWPEFRVIVAIVSTEAKKISSREAMTRTLSSSPYYQEWVSSSARLLPDAKAALLDQDIEKLGEIARLSYMRMHASMMAADPPIYYWLPTTTRMD